MVVCVLSIAGDQLPSIRFKDVVGKAVKGSPEQIPGTGSKVGVTTASTVMVKVAVVAH